MSYTSIPDGSEDSIRSRAKTLLGGRQIAWFFDDLFHYAPWNRSAAAGGSVAQDATRVGGVVTITSDAATTSSYIALGDATKGYPIVLPGGAGAEWYVGARFQCATALAGASEYMLLGITARATPTPAGLNSWIGVNGGDSGSHFVFRWENGGVQSSGVAINQSFNVFEAVRSNGTTRCFVNGAQVVSGDFYWTTASTVMFVAAPRSGVSATTIRPDWIALASLHDDRVTS